MYCKPLKMRSVGGNTTDSKILTDKQIGKIFQNVETIKDIAKTVWKKLESASKTWPESAPRIGNIILTSVCYRPLHAICRGIFRTRSLMVISRLVTRPSHDICTVHQRRDRCNQNSVKVEERQSTVLGLFGRKFLLEKYSCLTVLHK